MTQVRGVRGVRAVRGVRGAGLAAPKRVSAKAGNR